MDTLQSIAMIGGGGAVLGLAVTAIVLALRLSGANEQRDQARAAALASANREDAATKALAIERNERALERQRAKEQIAALIVDLEASRAATPATATPDAAADRLRRVLERARQALGHLGGGGGAPGLPGDGAAPAGPAA